ncbi:unnamed protein product [Leptosia nina]|uniref:Uncharacterized protein n=1 Tax=Leptosia nina TaxID=320188 RepID=A0AAV1J4A6_9NEOP
MRSAASRIIPREGGASPSRRANGGGRQITGIAAAPRRHRVNQAMAGHPSRRDPPSIAPEIAMLLPNGPRQNPARSFYHRITYSDHGN